MESHIAKNFHFFKKHDECFYNVSHYIFAQKKCAVDLKQQEIKNYYKKIISKSYLQSFHILNSHKSFLLLVVSINSTFFFVQKCMRDTIKHHVF